MNELWTGGSAWILSGAWIDLALRGALAATLVGLFLVAARLATIALARLRRKSQTGRPLIYIVEKLVGYGVVFAGILVALSTLGVDLTSLTVFAGALGVGVGLGLQGVVREFVSGLVAIFDSQIQVGDFIELENGVRGEIIEVGPRATRVRTNDGVHVVIPNSRLIENQVINWTLKGGTRRIHVPFSVAYGVDRAKVRDVVMEAARAVPFTLPDEGNRKTQVWLTGFGDSALNFQLVVWPTVEAVRRPSAMNAAYAWAIADALDGAGIEIPFPQLDLRVRSLFGREGDEAAESAGFGPRATQPRAVRSDVAPNDAAEALLADAEESARTRSAQDASR